MIKLKNWKAFEAPEKPDNEKYGNEMQIALAWHVYKDDLAEAKANALEVGNPNLIVLDRRISMEPGECIDWPGSAVIKDGKYILTI